MKKQRKPLYSACTRSKAVVKGLPEFILANQGSVFSIGDLPDGIREAVAEYHPLIKKAGFRLLSSVDLPGVLVQGQLMFWPVGEEPPADALPHARGYAPVTSGRPIGIDLFSGAGGLSMGFEQAGFDIAACVEIDPIHCATHEYNFPYAASICGSVTDLTGDVIRQRSGTGDAALLTLNMRQAADHFGVSASVIGQRTRKKGGDSLWTSLKKPWM